MTMITQLSNAQPGAFFNSWGSSPCVNPDPTDSLGAPTSVIAWPSALASTLGTPSGTSLKRNGRAVFAFTINFSTHTDGGIFDLGSTGVGAKIGIQSGQFYVTAGDGDSVPNMDITAQVSVSAATYFPTSQNVYTVIEISPDAPGYVRLWVDNNLVASDTTDAQGALELSLWTGSGPGGWGQSIGTIAQYSGSAVADVANTPDLTYWAEVPVIWTPCP